MDVGVDKGEDILEIVCKRCVTNEMTVDIVE